MKMRAIIVEDEPKVRKGLAELVNWGQYGLELAGTAANGLEGLELFLQCEPHLVVADIRMPVMDGLAMTEAIMERKPDTKVLIISGHDEFQYAQRCIALGVTNYLLKPIGKKQFHAELEQVVRSWREDRLKGRQIHLLEEKLKSHLPVLYNTFLDDWLSGNAPLSEEALQETFAFLGVAYDFDNSAALALFELDISEAGNYSISDRKLLEFAMHNIVSELAEQIGIVYQRGDGQTVVIYQSVSSDLVEDVMLWADRARVKVSAILNVSVTAGIGPEAVHIRQLPRIFQEARRLLRLKLTFGTDLILHERMVHADSEEAAAVLYESEQTLLAHAVEMNNIADIERSIKGLFDKWKSQKPLAYPDEVSFQFIGLFTGLTHRLGKTIRAFLDKENMKKWREPELFRSMDEMQEWWLERFIDLSRAYEGYRSDRKTKIVQQAKEYIDRHIYDQVTREAAADHVYVNASYLSRLFRDVTGESFSDFVMRKKMERAIHLLQIERVMVYEVADRLGYKDPSYFARVFKKYTGKSPSEYQ
ncbi:response regulator [Paenibacillus sp. J5C_2022]|uniref:response regulator n=1 Tax=Paenibacillus sp. J5C2022 TaxID=2977129 RepID=UPI0021CEF5ED|nr:response regulator [Paenibacillus sp. J5C2022]MCU6709146.1 response regulator [Paenibacillus sp. J5C2022]